MQISQAQRFHNLDLIRFLLVYLVVVFHAYMGWKENFGAPSFVLNEAGNSFSPLGVYIDRLIYNISLAGDVFFMISGFLITLFLMREQDVRGDIYIRGFYMRRALRILPLYFLVILLAPLFHSLMQEKSPDYPYWLFFIGNLDLAYNGWGPISINFLWYIAIEIQFYLVIPIILVIIRRKHLPLFFTFVIFTSFVFRIYAFHSPTPWNHIYLHTLGRMDAIAIGCWLGIMIHQRKDYTLYTSFPKRLLLYFVFFYLISVDVYADYSNIFFATAKKYMYLIMCCFFLANYLFNPTAKLRPKKINIFHRLGRMTYGIYIFSNLAVATMVYFFKNYHVINSFWIYFALINILLFPMAFLSYNYLETPFVRLHRFFSKNKTIPAPGQAN